MKDRIKTVRKAAGISQTKFGESVGVSLSAVQKWEMGVATPSDTTILLIAQKYGVNETWLRTGAGEMRAAPSREAEIGRLVRELMAERPDSFKSSLISALLRLAPEEWALLEKIYESIKESPEG